MQLILYYAPNACSLVPYVTLTEAGAPFEVHPLNFRKSHNQFHLDLSQFKNCMAHFERMKQRPSVRKLLAYEQEVQTAFAQAA